MTSMSKKFDSSEAIKFGWSKMKENVWFFVQAMLILFSVQIIIDFIQKIDYIDDSYALSFAFGVLGWIIAGILEMGLIKIALNTVRGQKLQLEDLVSQTERIANFLLANLLYALKVFVGLLLFIVPGLIWAVKHMFYGYMVVDRHEGITDSLRKSGDITEGEKWNLVVFGFYCLGLNLLGMLCLFVGLLFTIPATLIATAYVFEKLAGQVVIAAAKEIEAPIPPVAPTV